MTNFTNLAADTSIGDLFTINSDGLGLGKLAVCTFCALILGALIAAVFGRGNRTTKSFSLTLILLPPIVQMVILLVNGSVGTGIAVMGAFGLVRFRSAPGSAKDICAIFLAMAAGLACGTQRLALAFAFTIMLCAAAAVLTALGFGGESCKKCLKITIPESLDYSEVFDDIFEKYTTRCELDEVKTTNMGSLYKLCYSVEMKKGCKEKEMIDRIRERNGNLEISLGRTPAPTVERL
ncbi:MAG: DUF4956 domain-containing protein [Oscillospiraceae bacterium]